MRQESSPARGPFDTPKSKWLVRDVFGQSHISALEGPWGSGTCGIRPRVPPALPKPNPCSEFPFGICMAHNGNLINADDLNEELFRSDRRHINTSSDSEVLLNVFAHDSKQ